MSGRRKPPAAADRAQRPRDRLDLVDVREVAPDARRVVAEFERDFRDLLAGAEVHHIGATALPYGHTKGDVDVNVRVEAAQFPHTVARIRRRLAVAQPENWSDGFASFATDVYGLPLGIQLTSIGSKDDFLLALRDRMRADHSLLRRYDEAKVAAASKGADAYWEAKNQILRDVLDELTAQRSDWSSSISSRRP